MNIPFCKFHGFGNDYIVIERKDIPESLPLPDLAKAICHRNTGVGSDGIAVIDIVDGEHADYSCQIVNPDGSYASFSGNGTRCAVSYLYYKHLWSDESLRLKTRSGVKNYQLLEKKGDTGFLFEAEIGIPHFESEHVPVLTEVRRDHVVNEPIEVDGAHYLFSAVNTGNPVACIFVESFSFDWRAAGKAMETAPNFPERANIVFVKVIDNENIELRIWERGAGETAASGTCASAAAVLSSFLLKAGRKLNVHSPGGTTEILWREDDEIVIKGTAEFAFCGEWPA